MKLLTIVGARPQFTKAAMVSRALLEVPEIDEHIVHTGQHYDERMSDVFFEELGIPRPMCNLQIGSGTHGAQTGRMLEKLEGVYLETKPDMVLVFGDTNSTIAGALAAAKLHIPVAHVEAGLRSFNRRMPEEVNRVLTDHISKLLFCPTDEAVRNLAAEGVTDGVHLVGDVMYDCAMAFLEAAQNAVGDVSAFNVTSKNYVLMTCHRAENTDDPERLESIFSAVKQIAGKMPVLFLVHPRIRSKIDASDLGDTPGLLLAEPATYLEMLVLESNAAVILTDSGGVQKEAFFYGVPCVTMRDETEWTETVDVGANTVVGADRERIVNAFEAAQIRDSLDIDPGTIYGEGMATRRIVDRILETLDSGGISSAELQRGGVTELSS